MRGWLLAILGLLAVSCAKLRQEEEVPWPAHISNYDGFSSAQQVQLTEYISDLNSRAGRTLVSTETSGDGFPITVRLVTAPNASRAGYSIRSDEACEIQLSTFIFEPSRPGYVESVFLHEIGHCGKLKHTPNQGVMFETTSKWSQYSPTMIANFVNDLTRAVGL